MRILAIVPSITDTSPGQRYRIEQWQPHLKQLGIDISFAPFESAALHRIFYRPGQTAHKAQHMLRGFARRFALLGQLRNFDAIYLYREAAFVGPPIIESLIKKSGVPYVYDFDDAIYLTPPVSANQSLQWLKFPHKVGANIRGAAHVMAGNRILADYARQFNDQVSIVPSTIDLNSYTLQANATRPKNQVPIIGWSGSLTTICYLDSVRGALEKLGAQVPYRFRFIGPKDYQYKLAGVEVESLGWQSKSEADDLRPIDIGLMPLPDEPWTRGKCAMKALQYMALGIATVASPVGVNSDIIRDGDNGFLASSEDEWIEKLRLLLSDGALRKRVGEMGRETVEDEFAATVQAPRVVEIFRQIAR